MTNEGCSLDSVITCRSLESVELINFCVATITESLSPLYLHLDPNFQKIASRGPPRFLPKKKPLSSIVCSSISPYTLSIPACPRIQTKSLPSNPLPILRPLRIPSTPLLLINLRHLTPPPYQTPPITRFSSGRQVSSINRHFPLPFRNSFRNIRIGLKPKNSLFKIIPLVVYEDDVGCGWRVGFWPAGIFFPFGVGEGERGGI
jgi:hypothetical protein